MTAYYNEHDPFAAAWLRELIKAGHIAAGIVDERSIEDVKPTDLRGFTQCHFFAGIGVWSYALRQAGWPDDRPVWTGSCPCQPFSTAGKRMGTADERHLWPALFHLIRECQPANFFGEQVASKDGLAWFDTVQADLEGQKYTVGAADLCAAGFGAPHIRQRLYFVGTRMGESNGAGSFSRRGTAETLGQGYSTVSTSGNVRSPRGTQSASGSDTQWRQAEMGNESGVLGEATRTDVCSGGLADNSSRQRTRRSSETSDGGDSSRIEPSGLRNAGESSNSRPVDNATDSRRQETRKCNGRPSLLSARPEQSSRIGGIELGHDDDEGSQGRQFGGDSADQRIAGSAGLVNGFWREADWIACRDGKYRPVEPGTFPLAHGATNRVGRLRGYGNALVAPVAAAFIEAFLETEGQ
jgi:DNA (cytosine-5)-methyltransferase 1